MSDTCTDAELRGWQQAYEYLFELGAQAHEEMERWAAKRRPTKAGERRIEAAQLLGSAVLLKREIERRKGRCV